MHKSSISSINCTMFSIGSIASSVWTSLTSSTLCTRRSEVRSFFLRNLGASLKSICSALSEGAIAARKAHEAAQKARKAEEKKAKRKARKLKKLKKQKKARHAARKAAAAEQALMAA